MPDLAAHLDQAKHNEAAYDSLSESYPDWAATTLFYAALHYVDAHLAHYYAKRPANHSDRDRAIYDCPRTLRAIWADYRALKDASRNARYNCHRPGPAELQRLWGEKLKEVKRVAGY